MCTSVHRIDQSGGLGKNITEARPTVFNTGKKLLLRMASLLGNAVEIEQGWDCVSSDDPLAGAPPHP